MKKLYGLIGYPLGHSFSERYFAEKFEREGIAEAEYRNFPIADISLLPNILAENPLLAGLNVTIPYKEQVVAYLDDIDPTAEAIGAVNCIRITNGKLKGYNADVYGFETALLSLIGEKRPPALILGTGGAAKAVRYVLAQLGIPHMTVSRSRGGDVITYAELDEGLMDVHKLIINTSPLGTFPNVDAKPAIPYSMLTPEHMLFDLVYNPPTTAFMQAGMDNGAAVMNGYGMLVGQAERSWEIWNSQE